MQLDFPPRWADRLLWVVNDDDDDVAAAAAATSNDDFCQRLVDAGAIVIGKTNTPEHGLGSHTYNTRWGTTINPYSYSSPGARRHRGQKQTTESAGGSSGGAAVAVATRMLCAADGSDMMGSLRNPAGWKQHLQPPTDGRHGRKRNQRC